MKDVLQQMGLWPTNVDVLSPNTDARHKHVIFTSNDVPNPNLASATQKMQFFDAMAESNISPQDMHGFGFADVSVIRPGETPRETPVIVRFSQIEKALHPERDRGAFPER
jgi:hypothetical protein